MLAALVARACEFSISAPIANAAFKGTFAVTLSKLPGYKYSKVIYNCEGTGSDAWVMVTASVSIDNYMKVGPRAIGWSTASLTRDGNGYGGLCY